MSSLMALLCMRVRGEVNLDENHHSFMANCSNEKFEFRTNLLGYFKLVINFK